MAMSFSDPLPQGVGLSGHRLYVPDSRGWIQRIMRNDDPEYKGFGEVYLSSCFGDAIKGWHRHKRMTLNYMAVLGIALIALYDDRPESPTYGLKCAVPLATRHASRVLTIPPGVWNAYRVYPGALRRSVIICNFADLPHDPEEIERRPVGDFIIPWPIEWGRYEVSG